MSILDSLISLFTPYDCISCGAEGTLVCNRCAKLMVALPHRCYSCLQPSQLSETCHSCLQSKPIDSLIAGFTYGGTPKELISRLKYSGAQAAAKEMAKLLRPKLESIKRSSPYLEQAILVPVPTASSRARSRGYDQATLLVKEISRLSGLDYTHCLSRSGQSRQVGASREVRKQQLKGKFTVKNIPALRNTRIILVDDVLTTGATLEAAAGALRVSGANQIQAIVFAAA